MHENSKVVPMELASQYPFIGFLTHKSGKEIWDDISFTHDKYWLCHVPTKLFSCGGLMEATETENRKVISSNPVRTRTTAPFAAKTR